MPAKTISYETRLSAISTRDDLDNQIRLSQAYEKRLGTMAVKAETLEEKLTLNSLRRRAKEATKRLQADYYDIIDALA